MPLYRAHGLTIASDVALPELPELPNGGEPDHHIRYGTVRDAVGAGRQVGPHIRVGPEGDVRVAFPGVRLRVPREGAAVLDAAAHADARWVRLALMGTVLGTWLFDGGRLPMHGSAVATAGGATLFVGDAGAGKSTTVAALAAGGADFLSDDLTALALGEAGPVVLPGGASVKLWAGAASALGVEPDSNRRVDARDKYFVGARHGLARPVSLARVVVLGWGEESSVEALAPAAGLGEILRHTHRPALHQARHGGGAHLHRATRLAGVPILRWTRRRADVSVAGTAAAFEEALRRAG